MQYQEEDHNIKFLDLRINKINSKNDFLVIHKLSNTYITIHTSFLNPDHHAITKFVESFQ